MGTSPPQQGRRAFLQRTVAIVPAAALAPALVGCSDAEPVVREAPDKPAHLPTAQYLPRFFGAEEWAFVVAACDRLIPDDEEGPGAVAAGVPNFIDIQLNGEYGTGAGWYMQGPFNSDAPAELGYQSRQTPREIYRAGIAATNGYCREQFGALFSALSLEQQNEVLTRMESGNANGDDVELSSFFEFMWENVSQGYLADPVHGGNHGMSSWTMIGFPGARADFVDWAPKHNTPYPLGPVSLSGTRS